MNFPLWQYLNQPIWDDRRPFVLNPIDYWRIYRRRHLDCCLRNAFLEHCWSTNYQTFVIQNDDFCSRVSLEEDPLWLAERCWHLQRRSRTSQHPENRALDREL